MSGDPIRDRVCVILSSGNHTLAGKLQCIDFVTVQRLGSTLIAQFTSRCAMYKKDSSFSFYHMRYLNTKNLPLDKSERLAGRYCTITAQPCNCS